MGGIGIFQSAVQEMRPGIIKLAVSFHGLLSGSLFFVNAIKSWTSLVRIVTLKKKQYAVDIHKVALQL